MPILRRPTRLLSLAAACAVSVSTVLAWDYPGHRLANTAALHALPADFPAFVKDAAAAERIAFLAGEPDRWRNVSDLPIRHVNGVDHYLDLEQVPDAGMDPAQLPTFRYDFAVAFAAGRSAHPDKFPPIDPKKNAEHSREWPGFAPWAITEQYGKLKSAFSYYQVLVELGTPEEVRNAEQNIIYLMGIMGHYVADLAQPLHTTVHHNGWVGDNPQGYTRWAGFHQWVDGGVVAKTGIKPADVIAKLKPAQPIPLVTQPDGRDPMFVAVVQYLITQNARVEPLYQLEKAGKMGPQAADLTEAREFIEQQLAAGATMLSNIWLTAWRSATPDTYLRGQLEKRQNPPAAK